MMKKALALVFLTFVAVPLFAQTSEFGLLIGGGHRRIGNGDRNETPLAGDPTTDNLSSPDFWKLSDGVREAYFAIKLDPGTRFKIKVGEMDTKTFFNITDPQSKTNYIHHFNGKLEHIDGIVDYRFSEPFGSTGLFGGLGLYRQSGAGNSETNIGGSFGVNGDFPLSPRYGVVVEATYHYVKFDLVSHYVTGTAGLRISF